MSSGTAKSVKKRVAAAMYQVGTLENYSHEDAKEVYAYPEFKRVYRRAKKNYAQAVKKPKVINPRVNRSNGNAPHIPLSRILRQRELNKKSNWKPRLAKLQKERRKKENYGY